MFSVLNDALRGLYVFDNVVKAEWPTVKTDFQEL